MPVVQDLIDQGSVEENNEDGYSAMRTFLVTDVDGQASNKMALAIVQSGIPAVLDPHPSFTGLFCLSRVCEPVRGSTTSFRVTCRYGSLPQSQGSPNYTQVTYGATVQSEETNKDKDGNVMEIPTWKANDPDVAGNPQKTHEKQPGLVQKQFPQITMTFRKKETTPPMQKAYDYTGYINSVSFNGFPAETVLCTGIRGDSPDSGKTWDVVYEFACNLRTWKAEVAWVDPITNLPSKLATEQNGGIKKFDIYKAKDFNQLNLLNSGT